MIKFKDYELGIHIESYVRGGNAITLYELDTGEPFMVATSWIDGLKPDEVAIKNYSENEGILEALISNNIIHIPHRISGIFPIAKLVTNED